MLECNAYFHLVQIAAQTFNESELHDLAIELNQVIYCLAEFAEISGFPDLSLEKSNLLKPQVSLSCVSYDLPFS